MDIFGGKCLKDIVHFYDKKGNKTMIKRIHDLMNDIEEDLDPDYKYVDIEEESSEEDVETSEEVLEIQRTKEGFYSLK
tara:strand:- start:620 stop:853 length:234 start_codon:yes stop_codon:yes gene_type:complete